MGKLARVWRHRRVDETDVRRVLDEAALGRLQARVANSERRHSGEIRLCIEAGLPLADLWSGTTARERAVAMFGRLGVWDTADNNGVLIYLLFAEHAIEIVADRGVAQRVSATHWQAVVGVIREAFRAGQFEDGLMQAIEAVDAVLAEHFRLAPGQTNPNELSDRPHMG